MSLHVHARCCVYPRSDGVSRFPVPDDKVSWTEDFPHYDPVSYTSDSVRKFGQQAGTQADPEDPSHLQYDCVDKFNNVDRVSHEGVVDVANGVPRNPRGRTGIIGRGRLRRWGPNHAADPIVTRWKRDEAGDKLKIDGRPVLQFVAVQRKDNGSWAIPGGMVDPGENRTATIIREFGEEALNSLNATEKEKEKLHDTLARFFENGITIYKGYVDDPRNTDNSWMETKAVHFHDDTGTSVGAFELNAGDDAADCKWMDVDSSLNLYADHKEFLKTTAEQCGAYW